MRLRQDKRMPDPQNNDTLEAVLLRKAASIGKQRLPEPTLSMMPMPPTGKIFEAARGLGTAAKGLTAQKVGDTLNRMPKSLFDMILPGEMAGSDTPLLDMSKELTRLVAGRAARTLAHDGKRAIDWLTEGTPIQTGSQDRQ
jgi:hypothetical protein